MDFTTRIFYVERTPGYILRDKLGVGGSAVKLEENIPGTVSGPLKCTWSTKGSAKYRLGATVLEDFEKHLSRLNHIKLASIIYQPVIIEAR